MFKYSLYLFIPFLLLLSCKDNETVRKPLSASKSVEKDLSIKRNTAIMTDENDIFKEYMTNDKDNTYIQSNKGFWFTYIDRQIKDSIHPNKGDIANYTYAIYTTNDSLIYPKEHFGQLSYKVDEEDILPILRNSLKVLKTKETIKVLSPSLLAYGYMGDQDKITKNQPLVIKITLESINKLN